VGRLGRAALSFAIAGGISWAALRRGSLSPSGAAAALGVGGLVLSLGGAGVGAGLITFFLTGSGLSRYRAKEKEAAAGDKFDKGGRRDAAQVLANGGAATLLCVAHALAGKEEGTDRLRLAALGSLAAAAGDTWATEIGVLARGAPRLVIGWREVPAGTSGAVSGPGLLGMMGGASLLALIALLWPFAGASAGRRFGAVLLGGVGGAMADSLLGAAVQERRRCPRCAQDTEQRVHVCGARTEHAGGVAGLDNDWVNALSTALGGAITWALLR
jgi:uncharacterized protein (TIGR00297 family)